MQQIDHYAALGVSDTAAHTTIRAAYRRLMRETHPDVAGADPRAAERAVEANAAWSVLKDPRRRAEYDRQRTARRSPVRPQGSDGAAGSTVGPMAWGVDGPRPVSAEDLREAAARHSAFGQIGRDQREAFSAASWRIGVSIVLVGVLLLAVVVLR